jgi:hypothetical protein
VLLETALSVRSVQSGYKEEFSCEELSRVPELAVVAENRGIRQPKMIENNGKKGISCAKKTSCVI